MTYRYKVVPFIGQSKGNLSASDVASQLESIIRQHASAGWEFYQLSDVNIEVQPGCLAGLVGAKVQYVRFDQLIFRGDSSVVSQSLPVQSATNDSVVPPAVGGSRDSYQPEAVAGGKVKCWKCGETNRPEQDKCWDCFTPLYQK